LIKHTPFISLVVQQEAFLKPDWNLLGDSPTESGLSQFSRQYANSIRLRQMPKDLKAA
jgi:hypothetical protein